MNQPSSRSIELTPEQVESLEELRRKFTQEELAELARREAQVQAELAWVADADTLEEQQRRGDRAWAEHVERPRAESRIREARRPRVVAVSVPSAAGAQAAPRERRDSSSSRSSGQDPGGDDPPPPARPPLARPIQLALFFEPRIGGRR